MDSERVNEIRAALAQATQGEWKWHQVLAPYELPDSAISAGDLRVETPTPDKYYDAEIAFVIEAMKHGHVLMRKADADLIANAPAYLRHLLAENERLQKYIDELEMIIYHSVRLSDIMREGDSEETYKQIVGKINRQIEAAWHRLGDEATE